MRLIHGSWSYLASRGVVHTSVGSLVPAFGVGPQALTSSNMNAWSLGPLTTASVHSTASLSQDTWDLWVTWDTMRRQGHHSRLLHPASLSTKAALFHRVRSTQPWDSGEGRVLDSSSLFRLPSTPAPVPRGLGRTVAHIASLLTSSLSLPSLLPGTRNDGFCFISLLLPSPGSC